MNLLKSIFYVYYDGMHKVICILGFKIKIRNYKKEINLLTDHVNELNRLNYLRIRKLLPANSIKVIELHIVDHCNLNCKGCHHFAPLVSESFLSLSEFERDLKRLFELTDGDIGVFNILGGEPLLHPQCIEFLETARKIFPNSNIRLITNGILLPNQPDSFYEKCGKNNIVLFPTKYNLDINWELVKEKCKQFGVDFRFYMDNEIMYKEPIDLTGSQNATDSFLNCKLAWNDYFYLNHGKIYHCSKEAYMRFFSDYFKKDIKIPETDYIDIYKVNDVREIYNFMTIPPKFCSHCVKKIQLQQYKREISQKDINEWADL